MSIGGDDAREARSRLARFLYDLQSVLPEALNEHPDWFPSDLRDELTEAWTDLQPSFDRAIRYLQEPPDADALADRLEETGLTRKQLALKLRGFGRALRIFGRDHTKRALGGVLGWANVLLGTLSSIVPGTEAIKEYKEAYERASRDADDEA